MIYVSWEYGRIGASCKNDREVVLAAIKSFSGALEYASEELQKELR